MLNFHSVNFLNVTCVCELQDEVMRFVCCGLNNLTRHLCIHCVFVRVCVCACAEYHQVQVQFTMVLLQCLVFIMGKTNTQTVPHVYKGQYYQHVTNRKCNGTCMRM